MCAHYLFDPDFCNVAGGWEKGVVEKNVQDSRRRVWIEAGKERFGNFIELNAWLGQRCRALWDDVRHPEYEQFSVAEALEHVPGVGRAQSLFGAMRVLRTEGQHAVVPEQCGGGGRSGGRLPRALER